MVTTNDVMECERIWVEALNRGDLATADRIFAKDCLIDKVAHRWTSTGTHTGPLGPFRRPGRRRRSTVWRSIAS
jgi:hypothetical protein